MKPRILLLIGTFTVFYFFTDLNWQIGNYLAGNKIYGFLRTQRGALAEISTFIPFLLNSVASYLLFRWCYYGKQWRILTVILYITLCIPVMILIRYLIQESLFYQLFGYHNYSDAMRVPARYFMDNIYFAIYYSAIGIVFFFIQLSNYNQYRQQELILQNRTAELAFLRSQVNPHFLFNSLNNVYALVYKGSDNALPSISKLSMLLRYMLYEKDDWVPLQKEIQYLQNYIDLQLLRYDFSPYARINFNAPCNGSLTIAPLTLIPLVENAFKHGDLKNPDHPLVIELNTDSHILYFSVSNKISMRQKDHTGGIGLDNVSKRLALIYKNRHTLNISEKDGMFRINLNIILHDGQTADIKMPGRGR